MKPIDEHQRASLKAFNPLHDWDTCAFCGKAPATHETSDWDFVCEACGNEYEAAMMASEPDNESEQE